MAAAGAVLQAEKEGRVNELRRYYQYHWNAKDVAEWTNDTFDNILNMKVGDVFSIITLMLARAEYYNLTKRNEQ